jgi:hypothetical protein
LIFREMEAELPARLFASRKADDDMTAIIPKTESVNRRRHLKRRHCERSEAIQNLSAETVWIASERAQ